MARETSVRTTLKGSREFRAGLESIDRGFKSLGTTVDTIGRRMERIGRTMTAVGSRLTIGLTAPLLLAGGAVVKMAADATESENLFEVSMGNMADEARRFSEELRDQFGLNSFEVRKQIATFNQMVTAMGVSEMAAYELSKGLTTLTNDMASFFNLRVDEAFIKITAAISGEVEPLKRLGIIVNETTIKQTAMREGLVRQGEDFSEAQKVMLRYLTILEQTGNAQGDLARTMDSPTNRMRIFRARLEETAITIGNILIPFLNSLLAVGLAIVKPIEGLINSFNELSPAMRGTVIVGIGLLAAIGPLLTVFGGLARIIPVIVRTLITLVPVVASLSIEFIAVTAAATGLAATFIALSRASPQFESAIGNTFRGIGLLAEKVGLQVKVAFTDAIAAVIEKMAILVEDQFPKMAASFDLAVSEIRLANRRAEIEIEILGQSAADTFDRAGEDIVGSGETFVDTFKNLPKEVINEVKGMISSVTPDIEGFLADIGGSTTATADEVKAMMEETRQAVLAAFRESEGVVKASTANKLKKQFEKEVDEHRKAAEEKTKIADDEFKFLVDTGQKTLDDYIARKNTELGIHMAVMSGKLEATNEEKETELKIRQEIADLNQQLAEQQIERLQNTTGITDEEAQKQLVIELLKYDSIGEAGSLAAQRISEELQRLSEESDTANKQVIDDLTDTGVRGVAVAQRMHGAMQNFFVNMIKGAESTKNLVKQFFIDLADAILAEFARIAASEVFKVIFGGEGGGGGGGGGFLSGVFGGGGGSPFGSILSTGASLLGGLNFGSLFSGGSGLSAATNTFLSGGSFYQTGGRRIVQRPTLFAAGEHGLPEEVSVRPLGGRAPIGAGATIVFSGINIVDPISRVDFERAISRSIIRGNRDIL